VHTAEFVFGLIEWTREERVLDVGCGNGLYLDARAA
jgi:cyclopropane fatty-acyl-phospholipid synthase-like methyltransferase